MLEESFAFARGKEEGGTPPELGGYSAGSGERPHFLLTALRSFEFLLQKMNSESSVPGT
jgi:hypothetical protein